MQEQFGISIQKSQLFVWQRQGCDSGDGVVVDVVVVVDEDGDDDPEN